MDAYASGLDGQARSAGYSAEEAADWRRGYAERAAAIMDVLGLLEEAEDRLGRARAAAGGLAVGSRGALASEISGALRRAHSARYYLSEHVRQFNLAAYASAPAPAAGEGGSDIRRAFAAPRRGSEIGAFFAAQRARREAGDVAP